MKTILKKLCILAAVFAAILISKNLFILYQTAQPPKSIELAMPYSDIEILAHADQKELGEILAAFKKAGLTSISLSPASANRIPELQNHQFHIILRGENTPGVSENTLTAITDLFKTLPTPHTLLFEGPEVLGYPHMLPQVTKKIDAESIQIGWVELYPQSGIQTLTQALPNNIIRVHSIAEIELHTLTENDAIDRYIRAAKERRISLLFIHPFIDRTQLNRTLTDQNVHYISTLSEQLKKENFSLAPVTSKKAPRLSQSVINFERGVACFLAILIPIVAIRHAPNILTCFLLIISGTLAFIAINQLHPFQMGIHPFLGIQICILIPLCVIAALYKKNIFSTLRSPITVLHLLLAGIVLFYLIRSGNGPIKATLPFELSFRSALEDFLIVRPRSKEIFLAYPALFFFFLNYKKQGHWLLAAAAALVPVSVLNTFAHFHIPSEISIYRSILGFLLGYGVYHCYDLMIRIWQIIRNRQSGFFRQ